jgi:hypothetical protein
MNYQLVLQFRGDSLGDYDKMIALEDALTEALQGLAIVDGHDVGSGETNIFIYTSNPLETFSHAKPIFIDTNTLASMTAAYRLETAAEYTVIWPQGSTTKFEVQ